MNVLFTIVLCVGVLFAAPPLQKKVQPKKTDYEQAIGSIESGLKVQIAQIQKTKDGHANLLEKINKESANLKTKSDSLYEAAKVNLKTTYDKEMAKIVASEKGLTEKKQQVEAAYQEALKAIEELQSPKK